MKKICYNCNNVSDRNHELDPLGEWKWCELHQKNVHEDDETCGQWVKEILILPNKPSKRRPDGPA